MDNNVIDRLDLNSADGVQLNMDALYKIAPSVFTEALDPKTGKVCRKVDFEALRTLLGDNAVDDDGESYQFTWVGKNEAKADAARPTNKTLRPVPEDSLDWDTTKNIYIEGDNLEVLKLLQRSYLGKVKMIYIDPPYNTGNDFVYDDDFARTAAEEDLEAGNIDELGNRYRKNTDTNGKFHSDWCSMIYPRLLVSRSLLTEDGVIFISIDENELDNLKKISDEIFGQSNFIAQLIWSAGRKNDSKHISVSHEYIICYFRNADYIKDNKIVWRERKGGLDDIYKFYNSAVKQYGEDFESIEKELKKWYKNLPDGHPAKDHSHYNRVDRNGIFFPSDISWPGGGGPKYQVLHPVTKKPVKIPSRGWITGEKNMEEWIKQGRVCFANDENAVPTLKSYLKEREMSVPYSVFYKDGRASSKRLALLMGDKVFENPKDEEIIQRLIEFCGTTDEDIILDFFSGSATTAHSVFLANAKQTNNRKFILVQLPEPIDPEKVSSEKSKKVAQNAISLLDSIGKPHNICEIGKERIRRAGKKIKEESPLTTQNLDTGFRVFRLDESNYEAVAKSPKDYDQDALDFFANNIKSDRTDLDLLFGAMLAWGVLLDMPMASEEVDGCKIYTVNEGDLVACFSEEITDHVVKAMAEKMPLRVLFRDSCFSQDAQKINIYEQFKQALDWTDDEAFKNIKVI